MTPLLCKKKYEGNTYLKRFSITCVMEGGGECESAGADNQVEYVDESHGGRVGDPGGRSLPSHPHHSWGATTFRTTTSEK